MVTVITDGYENASREFTYPQSEITADSAQFPDGTILFCPPLLPDATGIFYVLQHFFCFSV